MHDWYSAFNVEVTMFSPGSFLHFLPKIVIVTFLGPTCLVRPKNSSTSLACPSLIFYLELSSSSNELFLQPIGAHNSLKALVGPI